MNQSIYFKSALFDPATEQQNPINPIRGASLINWLSRELHGTYEIDEAMPEDWGWYSYIEFAGRTYLIGAIAFFEEGDDPGAEIEWAFQVDKIRTFREQLLGREKMREDDACFQFFKALFEASPHFQDVQVG